MCNFLMQRCLALDLGCCTPSKWKVSNFRKPSGDVLHYYVHLVHVRLRGNLALALVSQGQLTLSYLGATSHKYVHAHNVHYNIGQH